jgi:4-aminobutyrate aminotransferase
VECAIKLARHATGRPRFIGFLGAFHGRTMGSLAFTASKQTQQKGYFPVMPGVVHVPYPNSYRPLFADQDEGQAVLDYIERLFAQNLPPDEVAAILVEPLQGEGGYLVPPEGFLAGLRRLCDRHGILLIFDEVQSGIGRTGKMFTWEHDGVAPDIITLAKGLGSGLPIGVCVARKEIIEHWPVGAHGNTFGGNPISCAAALATLELVRTQYMDNARVMGGYFMQKLRDITAKSDLIGDVRGRGLMVGMELVKSRRGKEPAPELARALVSRAYQNGLLLLTCGASTVRFIPPLSVDQSITDEAIAIIEQSLAEVAAGQAL